MMTMICEVQRGNDRLLLELRSYLGPLGPSGGGVGSENQKANGVMGYKEHKTTPAPGRRRLELGDWSLEMPGCAEYPVHLISHGIMVGARGREHS
jgi:hypothetical protein